MSGHCPMIIDFEASSLNSDGSYPIEIAWTKTDGQIVSYLISLKDVLDDVDWSPSSEEVHGIPLEEVLSKGVDPRKIVDEFLADRNGRAVISDAPFFDYGWLKQLFQMAGEAVPVAQIIEYEHLLYSAIKKRVDDPRKIASHICDLMEDGVESHRTHRAAGDVLALRNTYIRATMIRPEVSFSI